MNTPLILMTALFATSVIALIGWSISHSNAKDQERIARQSIETAQYYSTLNDDLMDQLDEVDAKEAARHTQRMAALDKANAANRARRQSAKLSARMELARQMIINSGKTPAEIMQEWS